MERGGGGERGEEKRRAEPRGEEGRECEKQKSKERGETVESAESPSGGDKVIILEA